MAPPIKSTKQINESDDADTPPSNNLWIDNLSADVRDADLMDLFTKYGALDSVTTYSSRSYAFVFFKRVEDAKAAKDALQGTELRGSQLKIEFARPATVFLYFLKLILSQSWTIVIGVALVFVFIAFFAHKQYNQKLMALVTTNIKRSKGVMMRNLPAFVTSFLYNHDMLYQHKAPTKEKDQK